MFECRKSVKDVNIWKMDFPKVRQMICYKSPANPIKQMKKSSTESYSAEYLVYNPTTEGSYQLSRLRTTTLDKLLV